MGRFIQPIEQKNFGRLLDLVPGIRDNAKLRYAKLRPEGCEPWSEERGGWMDLNVDVLYRYLEPFEDHVIDLAVAHNRTQNGDVMADPDMGVTVNLTRGYAFATHFQNDAMGYYVELHEGNSERQRKDLNDMLALLLKGALENGYKIVETKDDDE